MAISSIHELLLVEDDPVDTELFLRAAKKAGFATPIRTAASGEEALACLQDVKPNAGVPPVLVVTDINMPGLNGHEVVEDVRKDPTLSGTLFIMLSSSDQDKDVARAYRNGVIAYVPKGATSEAIARCVDLAQAYIRAAALP